MTACLNYWTSKTAGVFFHSQPTPHPTRSQSREQHTSIASNWSKNKPGAGLSTTQTRITRSHTVTGHPRSNVGKFLIQPLSARSLPCCTEKKSGAKIAMRCWTFVWAFCFLSFPLSFHSASAPVLCRWLWRSLVPFVAFARSVYHSWVVSKAPVDGGRGEQVPKNKPLCLFISQKRKTETQ